MMCKKFVFMVVFFGAVVCRPQTPEQNKLANEDTIPKNEKKPKGMEDIDINELYNSQPFLSRISKAEAGNYQENSEDHSKHSVRRITTTYYGFIMPNPYMPSFYLRNSQNLHPSDHPSPDGHLRLPFDNLQLPKDQASDKARQNWNWPGANFFPIYIRDPFLQMYYAITNMVEYGPNSGSDGPCKLTPRPQGSRVKFNSGPDNIERIEENKMKFKKGHSDKVLSDFNMGGVEIDSFDIENDPKFANSDANKILANYIGDVEVDNLDLQLGTRFSKQGGKADNSGSEARNFYYSPKSDSTKYSPDGKESTHFENQIHVEEKEEHLEENEKAEDINISNTGTRKIFNRENTGSGIFIHKLKVRQGGVAIAGPGGIATAGSGGTAIVGPNGVAYTHPGGLAIAGSGSRVVAVDPSVDLNEAIKNGVTNGTLSELDSTRIGKVVAVGPVVYYNDS